MPAHRVFEPRAAGGAADKAGGTGGAGAVGVDGTRLGRGGGSGSDDDAWVGVGPREAGGSGGGSAAGRGVGSVTGDLADGEDVAPAAAVTIAFAAVDGAFLGAGGVTLEAIVWAVPQ